MNTARIGGLKILPGLGLKANLGNASIFRPSVTATLPLIPSKSSKCQNLFKDFLGGLKKKHPVQPVLSLTVTFPVQIIRPSMTLNF